MQLFTPELLCGCRGRHLDFTGWKWLSLVAENSSILAENSSILAENSLLGCKPGSKKTKAKERQVWEPSPLVPAGARYIAPP